MAWDLMMQWVCQWPVISWCNALVCDQLCYGAMGLPVASDLMVHWSVTSDLNVQWISL